MMAYESNNLNNAPFGSVADASFDPFEPTHIEEKLDSSPSNMMGGLAAQLQPGFLMNSFGNSTNSNNSSNGFSQQQQQQQQQQVMNSTFGNAPTSLQQMTMMGFLNNNNAANNFQQQQQQQQQQQLNMNILQQQQQQQLQLQPTTLMNSMALQQPFLGANFQPSFVSEQQQQQRLPTFAGFQNNNSNSCNNSNNMSNATVKPILGSSFQPFPATEKMEPLQGGIPSVIHTTTAPTMKPVFSSNNSSTFSNNNGCFSSLDDNTKKLVQNNTIKAPITPIIPRAVSKSKRLLPVDFEPTGNYVICGNKRKYFESKGNIRFRQVCKLFLQEYVSAPTKIEKSAVVTKVMNILREDCPEGAFVSPQGGRWYAVSERTAREKVGTYFRDCLSDSYKSSAKNKIARRKIIKQEAQANSSGNNSAASNSASNNKVDNNFPDDGSLESISFYDVDDLTPVPL